MRAALLLILTALAATMIVASAQGHYYAGCKKSPCKRHVVKPYKGWLAKVRRCESGGNYRIHNPSGRYHGAYQFDLSSWRGAGGWGDPHVHSRTEQDYRAVVWLHRAGRGAWPVCG